jgi:hypothetical protein
MPGATCLLKCDRACAFATTSSLFVAGAVLLAGVQEVRWPAKHFIDVVFKLLSYKRAFKRESVRLQNCRDSNSDRKLKVSHRRGVKGVVKSKKNCVIVPAMMSSSYHVVL